MNIEIPFIYNIIFFFFRSTRKIQSILSSIFTFFFIKPAICIAKLNNANKGLSQEQRRSNSDTFVVLDLLLCHHKILWWYLNLAFKINSYLSGIKHNYNLYEHLLSWNLNIPVIGYEEDRTTFTFELLLGKTSEEGGRRCDFTWLTAHNIFGNFKIISKELNNDGDQVILNAVWLTGKERGNKFVINSIFPFSENLSGDPRHKPSSIYYPPKWLITATELFISGSAILTFFELTKSGWKIIIPWIDTFKIYINNTFNDIFTYIQELFTCFL